MHLLSQMSHTSTTSPQTTPTRKKSEEDEETKDQLNQRIDEVKMSPIDETTPKRAVDTLQVEHEAL